MKIIQVAVAVVINAQQEILLSLRGEHQHQGGRWEFPGGKLEADESSRLCLDRELTEELAIRPEQAELLCQIKHDYQDRKVQLDVWWVTAFSGQVQAQEGQEWRWVPAQELANYNFPAANGPILTAVMEKLGLTAI